MHAALQSCTEVVPWLYLVTSPSIIDTVSSGKPSGFNPMTPGRSITVRLGAVGEQTFNVMTDETILLAPPVSRSDACCICCGISFLSLILMSTSSVPWEYDSWIDSCMLVCNDSCSGHLVQIPGALGRRMPDMPSSKELFPTHWFPTTTMPGKSSALSVPPRRLCRRPTASRALHSLCCLLPK